MTYDHSMVQCHACKHVHRRDDRPAIDKTTICPQCRDPWFDAPGHVSAVDHVLLDLGTSPSQEALEAYMKGWNSAVRNEAPGVNPFTESHEAP